MGLTRFSALVALFACISAGCGWRPAIGPWTQGSRGFSDLEAPIQNPLMVPATDREFLWNQAVDTIDDFFEIEKEERVKLIGGVLTEGRIDTHPRVGSTIFEPWALDSTPGYERIHATLQSIRRRALVRVIPTNGGYLIDLAVHKEQEELAQPENATVGQAVRSYDASWKGINDDPALVDGAPMGTAATLGWVPLGRDLALEQRILRRLRGRLFDQDGPAQKPGFRAR
jgi:hypothetical protein